MDSVFLGSQPPGAELESGLLNSIDGVAGKKVLTLTGDFDHVSYADGLDVAKVFFCPFAEARVAGVLWAGHVG